ncbi:MAG: hypothetical protein U0575_15665 [Phycisphaerales bacterium]
MLDALREMLDREPFVPFRIVLTSGDRYDVTNPHMLAIGVSTVFYLFPRSDRSAALRLNQFAAIETIAEAA